MNFLNMISEQAEQLFHSLLLSASSEKRISHESPFFHYGDEAWFGIAYLSAVLKQAGHDTDLLLYPPLDLYMRIPFFQTHIEKRLMAHAEASHPDLIAFSAATYAYKVVKKMAARLKKAFGVPHVVGGIHATALPEHILKTADFDFDCLGEGEGASRSRPAQIRALAINQGEEVQ